MEVILLEKMRNLGVLGDRVKVSPGYARNYLIPQGKAVYANDVNLAKFNERRAELEKMAQERTQKGTQQQQQLQALDLIIISAKAGDEGKLFGSIGTRDIALAIAKKGVEVEKKAIRLPEGVLRKVGEYEVEIDLEGDLVATVKIAVTPES